MNAARTRFAKLCCATVTLAIALGLGGLCGAQAYAEQDSEQGDAVFVEVAEGSGDVIEALGEDQAPSEEAIPSEEAVPSDEVAYEEEAIANVTAPEDDPLSTQASNSWTGKLAEGEWRSFRLNDSDLSTGTYSKAIAEFTLAHRSNVSLVTSYQPTNVGSGSFSINVVEASGKFSGELSNRSLSNSSKTMLTSPISDNRVTPKSIPAGRYLVTYTYRNTHNWNGGVDFEVRYVINPLFEDVSRSSWARDVVADAVDKGYMSGYDASYFGTNDPITRGQVATILWNMARKPAVGTSARFADVSSGQYYATAVAWAASKGIVSGYKDGTFKPDAYVTRQELATMLHNYAVKYRGASTGGGTSAYASMADSGSVASYARPAVGWCFAHGVLTGSQGKINPKGTATRAEAAKMIVKVAALV